MSLILKITLRGENPVFKGEYPGVKPHPHVWSQGSEPGNPSPELGGESLSSLRLERTVLSQTPRMSIPHGGGCGWAAPLRDCFLRPCFGGRKKIKYDDL